MRPSGERLFEAFARGATEAGADVTSIGMVSTDALYFAVGKYGFDGGVMITASHNPAQYNGMKFTRAEAQAISLDTGLARDSRPRSSPATCRPPPRARNASTSATFSTISPSIASRSSTARTIKPFKIAIDAGNGMAGETVPHVFKHLPCEVVPLFFELDGSFPNHPASPIEPENMVDLQAAVRKHGCDLGVAFDGDADRMFIVDEKGDLIDGSTVTALVALNTLKKHPGARFSTTSSAGAAFPSSIRRPAAFRSARKSATRSSKR